ncbi:MAG: diaminopimelate epimerase [Lachnospiraceae bacterium]|nr:diaminopimelate epimerase [Lachnospiraceae bacterium]
MKFVKMEGCGNDYVYVDCTKKPLEHPGDVAKKVSDRHFGIGSDGLILIEPSKVADFFMHMFNMDGSEGAMCGNGIRCVGKFVYDQGLTDQTHLTIETKSGIKTLELHVENGKVSTVTVDMGEPILEAGKIPVDVEYFPHVKEEDQILSYPLFVEGEEVFVSCVSMGNPHAIIYGRDIEELDLTRIGPPMEFHKAFPDRINTEWAEILDESHIKMRVWERGSGETWACGTGACAVAVSSILQGLCKEEVTIHLRGGDLRLYWNRNSNHVFMEGPARTVFAGEISLDD